MTEAPVDPKFHEISVWFAAYANPDDCYRAFEAYGHAMAAASAFEQLMALMVMKALALRLDKRANANIQPADAPALIKALTTRTYEHLRRSLCESFTLSDELRTGLADGKNARDELAHNFWQAHMPNLMSTDGVDVIAAVCASHANHFRLLTDKLVAETGVDVNDYVEMLLQDPDREQKLQGWQQLLRDNGLT